MIIYIVVLAVVALLILLIDVEKNKNDYPKAINVIRREKEIAFAHTQLIGGIDF